MIGRSCLLFFLCGFTPLLFCVHSLVCTCYIRPGGGILSYYIHGGGGVGGVSVHVFDCGAFLFSTKWAVLPGGFRWWRISLTMCCLKKESRAGVYGVTFLCFGVRGRLRLTSFSSLPMMF